MVKFFKKSTQNIERLEEYARRMSIEGSNLVRLKQRANTRWNSVYDMINSVNANRSMSASFLIFFQHFPLFYVSSNVDILKLLFFDFYIIPSSISARILP